MKSDDQYLASLWKTEPEKAPYTPEEMKLMNFVADKLADSTEGLLHARFVIEKHKDWRELSQLENLVESTNNMIHLLRNVQ